MDDAAQPGASAGGDRFFALIEQLTSALSHGDPIEGFRDAASRIAAHFGYSRAAVLALADDEPHTLYVVAASDDPTVTRLPVDLRKYPELDEAIRSREPVFVADAATSALLGEHADKAARYGGRSLLAVPLLADRRPLGCLALRSHEGRAPLAEGEGASLRLAAQLVAVALRGGRVIDTIREQTRRVSLASYEEQRRLRAIDQFRDFFESAADGMVVVDEAGIVLHMNRAAEQLSGYSRDGLRGRPLQDIVPEAQRAGLAEVVAEAASGIHLAGFDLELVTTSGEPMRVSVSTSTALAEHGAVVFAFRDVTLARALEDELRKTKDFLERLIDAAIDGIIAADMQGRLLVFNPGAERVFGYAAEEVLGKLPVWKLYPDGVARQIMAELRASAHGGVGRLEPSRREVRAKNGDLIPVSLAASIIYEDGREVGTVGIFGDLRDRLRIEQSLAQAQERLLNSEKQAVIAELAGTTAHELNQPLTSVMGYAELLLKRMSAEDGNRRAVEIVLREAERMAEIVRKIGRITRYQVKEYVGSTNILDLDKSTTE